ncbi:MAG: Uncharacterised protein [Prochlorococcus marinus str. MIT 9313]|nr:MAG: Uncharacterised protein [Prochlorococcus marinus str. MIT 9313]
MITSILKGPRQHIRASVCTDDVKPFLQQTNRMKSRSGSNVEHGTCAMFTKDSNIKIAFSFGPRLPINQSIPSVCEILNIFLLIMVCITYLFRFITKVLQIVLAGFLRMLSQSHADSNFPKIFLMRHIFEVGKGPNQLERHWSEQGCVTAYAIPIRNHSE